MTRAAAFCSALVVASLATPGLAQVKLEIKHPENEKVTFKSTTKLTQTLTINGMEIPTKTEETITATATSGKTRDDGSIPITRKIGALKAKIELPGNNEIEYDSASPDAAKSDNPILAGLQGVFKALVGVEFTTVMKGSKVIAVEGAETALDKAKDLDPMVVDQLKARFNAAKLKAEVQQEYDVLPDLLLRSGEPWERTEVMDIGGNQSLTFKKTYEYAGTVKEGDKTLDKITSKATGITYKMEPSPNSPVKVDKSDLKIDSSEGTLLFDRELGRFVSKKSKHHIVGDMTLEAGGQELPTKLDLTIESETVHQPKK